MNSTSEIHAYHAARRAYTDQVWEVNDANRILSRQADDVQALARKAAAIAARDAAWTVLQAARANVTVAAEAAY